METRWDTLIWKLQNNWLRGEDKELLIFNTWAQFLLSLLFLLSSRYWGGCLPSCSWSPCLVSLSISVPILQSRLLPACLRCWNIPPLAGSNGPAYLPLPPATPVPFAVIHLYYCIVSSIRTIQKTHSQLPSWVLIFPQLGPQVLFT